MIAQNTIKGRVVGFDMEIPDPVEIYDNNHTEIGKSDKNGFFEISSVSKTLIFKTINYDSAKVTFSENCSELEVILVRTVYNEFASSRKIDRIRKRGFSHLDVYHSKAFEKKLFKTERACHTEEFVPIKPELDKYAEKNYIIRKQIKLDFKELVPGDTLFVAFGIEEHEKKSLINYTAYTDRKDFECLIEGILVEKNKEKSGYNIVLRVTNLEKCGAEPVLYNNKEIKIGELLNENMKYFKVFKKTNTAANTR